MPPASSYERHKNRVEELARGSNLVVDKLLEAARAEFSEFGYKGGRVDNIARRADINKQLIYYYFGNKEKLYTATIQDAYRRILGDQDAVIAEISTMPPIDALERLMAHMFSDTDEYIASQRLMMDANLRGTAVFGDMSALAAAYGRLLDCLGDVLSKGAASGQFRAGLDPREVFISLMSIGSLRVTNAASMSIILGVDLVSRVGNSSSQAYGLNLIIQGLTP